VFAGHELTQSVLYKRVPDGHDFTQVAPQVYFLFEQAVQVVELEHSVHELSKVSQPIDFK